MTAVADALIAEPIARPVGEVVVGDVIDQRYELSALLEHRAELDVWRASDTRLGREIVLELIRSAGGIAASSNQLHAILQHRLQYFTPVLDAGIHRVGPGTYLFVVAAVISRHPTSHGDSGDGFTNANATSTFTAA